MKFSNHILSVALCFIASSTAVSLALDHPLLHSARADSGKLDPILQKFYDEAVTAAGEGRKLVAYDVPPDMLMSTDGQVTVEVIVKAEENVDTFKASLKESDKFVVNGCFKNECSVKTDVLSLDFLKDNDWVVHIFSNFVSLEPIEISPSLSEQVDKMMPHHKQRKLQTGVVSEASQAMYADVGRDQFNVDGTGIKIGVLSDSFNCSSLITSPTPTIEDDIANGDLPPLSDIQILEDFLVPNRCINEGRAMMQLIHDVAPGASLAFHTAATGQAAFAQGILALADAGCDIIVDDVVYFNEFVYQDGVLAQAVDIVKEMGVTYFTSVGNRDRQAWEGRFVPVPIDYFGRPYNLLSFDGSGSESSTVLQVKIDFTSFIFLFWSEPIFPFNDVINPTPNEAQLIILGLRAGGSIYNGTDIICQGFATTPYPIPFRVLLCPPGDIDVMVVNVDLGPDPDSVYMLIRDGSIRAVDPPPGSFAGTSYGQKNAKGSIAVGASNFMNTPGFGTSPAILNDYSSAGGLPVYFDANGQQLEKKEIRKTPSVVGPDGICTSFFFSPDPDVAGCYRFSGTSAAAPNVAAVAALLLEINPNLGPDDIRSILEYTAEDMDSPSTEWFDHGYDHETGYGFVDAQKAMMMASQQLPSSSPSIVPSIFPSPAPSYEYCVDDPSAACKFDDDGEPTHFSICVAEDDDSRDDDEYKSYCVKIKDYDDLSIGDKYKNDKRKVVVGCGCCETSNFPPGSKFKDNDKKFCYPDSFCGKPGDASFVVCDEKKGIAKVSVCVDDDEWCIDADDVADDVADAGTNGQSICGPCKAGSDIVL